MCVAQGLIGLDCLLDLGLKVQVAGWLNAGLLRYQKWAVYRIDESLEKV